MVAHNALRFPLLLLTAEIRRDFIFATALIKRKPSTVILLHNNKSKLLYSNYK